MDINNVKNFAGNVKNYTLDHLPEIGLVLSVPVHVAARAGKICEVGAFCLEKAAEHTDLLKPLVLPCASEIMKGVVEVTYPLVGPAIFLSGLALGALLAKHYYPRKVTPIAPQQVEQTSQ